MPQRNSLVHNEYVIDDEYDNNSYLEEEEQEYEYDDEGNF